MGEEAIRDFGPRRSGDGGQRLRHDDLLSDVGAKFIIPPLKRCAQFSKEDTKSQAISRPRIVVQ